MTVNEQRVGSGKKRLSQRRAARILGVSFEHLNRVLRGRRHSPRLVDIYNELIARHQHGGAAGPAETVAQLPEGAQTTEQRRK